MPCKCRCGIDIECGDTLCPLCEADEDAKRLRMAGKPSERDYSQGYDKGCAEKSDCRAS